MEAPPRYEGKLVRAVTDSVTVKIVWAPGFRCGYCDRNFKSLRGMRAHWRYWRQPPLTGATP